MICTNAAGSKYKKGAFDMEYEMEIAGLKRRLPLFSISEDTCIAAFIMFGDVEITKAAARELLIRAPEFDILFTAEAKSIPLVYEMARQAGMNRYVIARKTPKLYMKDIIRSDFGSITTPGSQALCIGSDDAELLKGKRVLIVDDVTSTGESLMTMEYLVKEAGGIIVAKMSVLAEGDSMERNDIITLEKLPLFNSDGTVKK